MLIIIDNCTTTYLAALSEPQSDALARNNILPPHFTQVFLILVLIFIGNCTITYLATLSEPQSDALAHNNILPPSLYAGLFDIGAHIDAQAHNNVLGSAEWTSI